MPPFFKDMRMTALAVLIPLILFLPLTGVRGHPSEDSAILIRIQGLVATIDEPTRIYVVEEGLAAAESRNVPLIIVLDTYGGYLDPAIAIANAIINAKVPVIIYIEDKAMSAGAIISVSANIVAMKPTAVIGAAQPIYINPVTGEITYINESKVINSLVSFAARYAAIRGRNTSAVEDFIKHNLVLNATEAVKYGVADMIAPSLDELIAKINGLTVNVSGTLYTIRIEKYEELNPSIRVYALAILRNPTLSSILFFIGVFGTMALLFSGNFHLLPIALFILLLALVSSDIEANYISIMLIALGSILLALEFFVAGGQGILGAVGILSLLVGFLLAPYPTAAYPVDVKSIWTATVIVSGGLAAILGFVLYKAVEAAFKRSSIRYTPEKAVGRATERIEPGKSGYIILNGEYWEAESEEIIEPGEEVEVIGRMGFRLKVRRKR